MGNKNYVVAIDLGFNKVVAALGTISADGQTIVKEIVSKPLEGGFVRGEITNIELVSTALNSAVEELEQRAGIKVDEAVVGTSGRQIVFATNSGFVYVGSDGEIRNSDVEKLCDNMNNVQAPEGKVILSRLPQYYKIDTHEIKGSPVGGFGRHLEATYGYVMASKAVLERIDKAFDRVGIKDRTYLPSAMASALVASYDEERESGVATIDIGANTTDVAVYYDNKVRYVASIPLGSDAINNDIRATAVPKNSVEKLKTRHGYATTSAIPFELLNSVIRIPGRKGQEKNKDISYRDLTAIIECRLVDIINFVNEVLRDSGYHDRIETLVLTGGGSQLKGIEVLFQERTGITTRKDVAASFGEESVAEAAEPANATVVGLLMMAIAQSDIKPTPQQQTSNEEDIEDDEEWGDDNDKKPKREKKRGEKKDNGPRVSFFDRIKKAIGKVDEAVFGKDIVDDEDI